MFRTAAIRKEKGKWEFWWKEALRCDNGTPYVHRWRWETPWFSIRIHHWLHSDDVRHFHDHPWSFVTLVLRGGYDDVTEIGRESMLAGMLKFRPASHRHNVQVHPGGAWTLLFTGPKIQKWGFYVNGKFKKANKYFLEHGAHQCD